MGLANKAYSSLSFYTRGFFITACLGASGLLALSYFTVPVVGPALALFGAFVFVFMIAEFAITNPTTKQQYNIRYEITIYVEILVNTISSIYNRSDYMLFIPIILGMLYINVNAIIRSPRIKVAAILFMLYPSVLSIIMQRHTDVGYTGLIIFFTLAVVLTNLIVLTQRVALDGAERQRAFLQTFTKLSNHLATHDSRNVMQKMQSLVALTVRDLPKLVEFESYVTDLDVIINSRTMDSVAPVNPYIVASQVLASSSFRDTTIQVIPTNATVECNESVLYTTIKNLCENAVEAARRRSLQPHLVVVPEGNSLRITDYSGGFDASLIKEGRSEKATSGDHGIFLRTITDAAFSPILGFSVRFLSFPGGTTVVLDFVRMCDP